MAASTSVRLPPPDADAESGQCHAADRIDDAIDGLEDAVEHLRRDNPALPAYHPPPRPGQIGREWMAAIMAARLHRRPLA